MSAQILLRKLVEIAGGASDTGYLLAIDGEGLETVESRFAAGRAVYEVYRPETELGLRRIVARSDGAPFIGLVKEELARRLPPDLVRRAHGGRVHALDLNEVLGLLLGAPVVGTDDPEIKRLAFAHLDEIRTEMAHRTLPTVIDRRLLDELLVEVCVGRRFRTARPGELLAEWMQHPPSWEGAVTELVRRQLPILHAAAGRLLAWALAKPERPAALVVHGALLDIPGDPAPACWGPLHLAHQSQDIGLTESAMRKTVVELAREALEVLGDAAGTWLTEAETLGRKVLAPSVLGQSTLLPLGLENRCAAIAARASGGEPVPTGEIDWLRRHRAAGLRRAEIAVLEELARLSRYLAEPGVDRAGRGSGSRSHDGGGSRSHDGALSRASELELQPPSAASMIRDWQAHGAFADLAAARLRRALAATGELHRESETVLAAWRSRRDEENLAFARALAAGYVKALHGEEVVPLHRLWTKVALREEHRPHRVAGEQGLEGGLFLVVMDGCSYPVFLELLLELAQRPEFPIGLSLGEDGRAMGLPALAPLPTITSHARSALFLGEIPHDPWIPEAAWREGRERTTDPARLNENKALAMRYGRRVFLKGDLADGCRALREALQGDQDVVAAVFNAVDDQIGSANTGAQLSVRAEAISGFGPSLRTALEAKRRVLFVADHGHSPFLSKELRVGNHSTPRYVELEEGQPVPEGFLEIDLDGLGGSPGRKAFAWKLGAYQGSPQVGFHGGCSLEEMVVPLAWLAHRGVQADEPGWWYGRAEQPVEAATTAPKPRPAPLAAEQTRAPTPPAQAQQNLFEPRPEVELLAARIGRLRIPEAVVAGLDTAERAALVVLAENASVRARDLAPKLGKPAGRIAGFMTRLNRRLHQSGIESFRAEVLPSGEAQYHHVPQPGAEDR